MNSNDSRKITTDLNNNTQFILDITSKIAKYFHHSTPSNSYQDIYDKTSSIIMDKCGDIFINLIDKEILTKCIWNKTLKTLRGIFWKETKEKYNYDLNYSIENETNNDFDIELNYPYLTYFLKISN